VVGHLQEQIRAELARVVAPFAITVRDNPDYREGSVVSLWHARDDLSAAAARGESTVIMDGDVLYDPDLMVKLRDGGGAPSAFLLDTRSEETGEEMMIGVRGGRARRIARRVYDGDADGNWDLVGESVGFFKVGPPHAQPLRAMLEQHIAEGHRTTEYEAVYDRFLDTHVVGHVPVGDAPWTEIDFELDVVRARDEILPAIERIRSSHPGAGMREGGAGV
jgi:choline kinase